MKNMFLIEEAINTVAEKIKVSEMEAANHLELVAYKKGEIKIVQAIEEVKHKLLKSV